MGQSVPGRTTTVERLDSLAGEPPAAGSASNLARSFASGAWRQAALVAGIAALYFGAARLGLTMAERAEQVTVVWPPSGIALAAVVLLGQRIAPGIWLGALAANVAVGATFAGAVGIACGNTLEALFGAWLLRRARFNPSLPRVRDVLALVGLAALISPVASATIGVTSLCLAGVQPWAAYGALWGLWWLGDATGDLLVAPFLLTWARASSVPWPGRRVLEAGAIVASLIVVSLFIFAGPLPAVPGMQHLAYLVFPLAIWAALRLGPRGSAMVSLITAVVAIWGTSLGYGPFALAEGEHRLVLLQTFMVVLSSTALMLGSAIAESRVAERRRAADYAVTRVLAESRTLESAAPRILQAICENLDWDLGGLWRVDAAAVGLRCVEVWHRPDLPVPAFVAVTRQTTFAPGVGMPGRVWESGQPAWIPDVVRDTNFPRAPIAAREDLHSAFGFPIRLGSEVLGVIEFFSREIREPDADLLRMFATVGGQIGQFIDRLRAEEELRRASEAKDTFLAVLGHELRNPLAPLRTALEVLRLRRPPDAAPEPMLDIMGRQLENLVRMVDDLLDVSRITRGRIELRQEAVDLATVIAATVESIRRSGQEPRLFSMSLPSEPLMVEADRMRLEQVIANLVTNAIRYTPRGGHVRVEASRNGEHAVLRVRDDGIGIRAEMLDRIFDLFVQSDRLPSRAPQGLGVGLTLVRSLVEMHGGTICATSPGPGLGSEFVVQLPLLADAASVMPQPSAVLETTTEEARDPSPLRVLVVDDNADAAESLAVLLRTEGHAVDVAYDVPGALDRARRQRPDVVLLDIGLPKEMDGYEVARRLRAEIAPPPLLVAVTGFGQAEDRRRSEEAGFDRHLVKPVEGGVLRQTLNELRAHLERVP